MDTAEQLREIKRALRGMMNGVVSASMREKGLTYKVNFGVELPRLQAWAQELPHTHELAQALWQEDIRECRLLAAMLQPVGQFPPQLADIWVESMRFTEEVECCVMYLFQNLPYASEKAYEWMASSHSVSQQCGFQLMARLFSRGARPEGRDADEFLDQAVAAVRSDDGRVASAARRAIMKYMDLGSQEEAAAEKALNL